MTPLILILICMVLLSAACFGLGYDVAEQRERKAKKILDAHLRFEMRQKRDLTRWVRENWPNEYAANWAGYLNGYQQGVSQGGDLEDDE